MLGPSALGRQCGLGATLTSRSQAERQQLSKPVVRRHSPRLTAEFPKRTVAEPGVAGAERMVASASSELNSPTHNSHPLGGRERWRTIDSGVNSSSHRSVQDSETDTKRRYRAVRRPAQFTLIRKLCATAWRRGLLSPPSTQDARLVNRST